MAVPKTATARICYAPANVQVLFDHFVASRHGRARFYCGERLAACHFGIATSGMLLLSSLIRS